MVDVIIDNLTNCLIDSNGVEYDTEYTLVKKTITKAHAAKLKEEGWQFDWSVPQRQGCEIYQLCSSFCYRV